MRYLIVIFTLLWTVLAHAQTAGQLQMDQWDGTNWRALTVTPGTSGQMLTWGAGNTITSTTLTKSLVGLSAVENTALSTWPGSTSITTLATVANPSWLTSLPWSKITSAPSFITGNQTITISGAISGSGTTAISTTLGSNQARDNLTGGSGSLNLSGFTLTLPSDVTRLGSTIAWTSVSKTGSSLADLATRSAADLTTGTLPVANGGVHPLVTTGDTGSGYGRIGLWDADDGAFIYFQAGAAKFLFPAIQATFFTGDGSGLTSLNAGNITTGTLGVPRGGTGATTLTANNVLLGNGGSAPQFVAPGTTGNVLTSNGTTWTSTAPATTNPAGSGSELQFRSSGSAFGAVTNSSVSGGTLTLGDAEALDTTPTAYLTLRNTTAATVGVPVQVSPSIVLEGQGWKTTATAASQTVRFRENILPVQGTANPSATWRLQSEINNSGTWTDRATVNSTGLMLLAGGIGLGGDTGLTITRRADVDMIVFHGENATGAAIGSSGFKPGLAFGRDAGINWSSDIQATATDLYLGRDAANTLAQRNGTNAQTFRLYETDSGANDEYLEFSAASGTNLIRPQATGTGTASVVRYHTTTTVFWTSGSGSPESVVTAPVGSIYTDTAGGAATTLYVKESGTGSTGWIAK